ncbi:MAG: hypothetical protein KGO96_11030 [Elusimicrobia bacterium]|nr:hypothetical protein [Elusimicrobiota bacterium]MDE2426425.1 hypothetical protein [Elusimicrobiota bacterium]
MRQGALLSVGLALLLAPPARAGRFPPRILVLRDGAKTEIHSEAELERQPSSDEEMTVFVLDTAGDQGFRQDLKLYERRLLSPRDYPTGTSDRLRVLVEADDPETFFGGVQRIERLGRIHLLFIYSHMGSGTVAMNGKYLEVASLQNLLDPRRLAGQARIVFAGCRFGAWPDGLHALEYLGYRWLERSGGSLGAFDQISYDDQDSPVGTSPAAQAPLTPYPNRWDQTGWLRADDFEKYFVRLSIPRPGAPAVFELGGASRVALPAGRRDCARGRSYRDWLNCIRRPSLRPKSLEPGAAL